MTVRNNSILRRIRKNMDLVAEKLDDMAKDIELEIKLRKDFEFFQEYFCKDIENLEEFLLIMKNTCKMYDQDFDYLVECMKDSI